MPKKKNPRKPSRAAYVAQTESTTSPMKARIIRWASISVILAILLSLMIAAISVSPSNAATPSPAQSCTAIDTDGDGVTNNVDSDIDGDGTVNGLDDDIDGDKILNAKDSDPAATNCGAEAGLPVLPGEDPKQESESISWIAAIAVAALGVGYLFLRRVRSAKK